jgi:hypothetical protein
LKVSKPDAIFNYRKSEKMVKEWLTSFYIGMIVLIRGLILFLESNNKLVQIEKKIYASFARKKADSWLSAYSIVNKLFVQVPTVYE